MKLLREILLWLFKNRSGLVEFVEQALRLSNIHLKIEDLLQAALDLEEPDPLVEAKFPGGEMRMYKEHKKQKMPFHFIPSVSAFDVTLNKMDWLYELFGLKRRKSSQANIENWVNGGANKYLFYMFKRLAYYRESGEGKKYWKLAWVLMNSRAFQVSSYNFVRHNWHRNLHLKVVRSELTELQELISTRATELDSKRVYIPKPQGATWEDATGARPLGVPKPAWRVYLHMLNVLLVWQRTGKEGQQHAYFPGKGVSTAWSELLDRLDKVDNIYEFDLKGFFDNVEIGAISQELKAMGLPPKEVHFFEDLCKNLPRLPKDLKLPEDMVREKDAVNKGVKGEVTSLLTETEMYANFAELGDFGQILLEEKCAEEGIPVHMLENSSFRNRVILAIVEEQWAILSSIQDNTQIFGNYFRGVPQGAATSCTLSTLALNHLVVNNDNKVIMYADDGLVLQNSTDIPQLTNRDRGIEIAVNKSSWVKYEGKWLKPLKFLGLTYIPPQPFSASKEFFFWCFLWSMLVLYLKPWDDAIQNWIPTCLGKLYCIILFMTIMLGITFLDGLKLPRSARMRASTRKGATLEFTIKEQFLAWLLRARRRIEYGGSASALNGKDSLRGWIWEEYKRFIRYPHGLKMLFKGKGSGFFLSRLYNNRWNIEQTADFDVNAVKGSWVEKVYPGYRYIWNCELRRSLNDQKIFFCSPRSSRFLEYLLFWSKQWKLYSLKEISIFNASSFGCHSMLCDGSQLGLPDKLSCGANVWYYNRKGWGKKKKRTKKQDTRIVGTMSKRIWEGIINLWNLIKGQKYDKP